MVSYKLRNLAINLTLLATLLAVCVIILGAYTRLKDAGLGCPDWPGCYGFLAVPNSADDIANANQAFPERPFESAKAWPEMLHRYFATALGFLVLSITALSIANRKHPGHPHKLYLTLAVLVIFQGLLGMWTVTMKLYPPVVMAHLLGGFTILSILYLLCLRITQALQPLRDARAEKYRRLAGLGLGVLIIQIALGGWTAANYAAVACTQLPICQGSWWQWFDLKSAFQISGHRVDSYEYALHLSAEAKITIHVIHRFGALVTATLLGWLAWRLWHKSSTERYRRLAVILTAVLALQLALGIGNVVLDIPLAVAVAHNAVAALLLMVMITIYYSLNKTQ